MPSCSVTASSATPSMCAAMCRMRGSRRLHACDTAPPDMTSERDA
ncbi:Uncharacterised protein [Bordetella pertussis]|nr:Uncharacterised protein [Bordetella pertussis]